MKFIESFRESDRVNDIYLCKFKQAAVTKNGKSYENMILQDKTGTVDAKIWDPNSQGIEDFDTMDYVHVVAEVTNFQGATQLNVKRARKVSEGEYEPSDYLPTSEYDLDEMETEFHGYIKSIKNEYLQTLLTMFFIDDEEFRKNFKYHSAAKSVHHGFVGGLLEHTLSIIRLCDYLSKSYPLLQRDLLLAGAMCHDIGKTKELSGFPENDYTDEGQLVGHIVMGTEMIGEKVRQIPNFPAKLANELKHCVISHHGELAYGSPKKPALAEAVALSFADNMDAKLQTMKEALKTTPEGNTTWQGYNRLFESNIRRTSEV